MGGQASATLSGGMPQAPWWARPMNSQIARVDLAQQLITQCRIARIVETGTFVGTTTEFFAQFGMPVITIENNPEYLALARRRLEGLQNVDMRADDSVRALQALAGEPIDRAAPVLFYLDAHWNDHLPLREEAAIATAHFPKAVLLVDDFAVPDDPGYGFDDYGPGKRLTLDYLLQGDLAALSVYFPSVPSHLESGARRGCVVATANAEIAAILDKITLLRRWKA
jgi:hypothetical protein